MPSDPAFNMHIKRDRLPGPKRLAKAQPHLVLTFDHYNQTEHLAEALRDDVTGRFLAMSVSDFEFPQMVTNAVVNLVGRVADSRNLARF